MRKTMHIKKKFLLTILLMHPFASNADASQLLSNFLSSSGLGDDTQKSLLFIGTSVIIAGSFAYFGHELYWKEKFNQQDYEKKEIEKDLVQVKYMGEIIKLGKETGTDPDGIDSDKVTEERFTYIWNKEDLRNKKNLQRLLLDNQTKQKLVNEFKQKQQEASLPEKKGENFFFPAK
jgi:hypothetical protein